jgi:hypothetical protein
MKKLIVILLMILGCSTAQVRLQTHIVDLANKQETKEIVRGSFIAFDKLTNCDYLRENFEFKWQKLFELRNTLKFRLVENLTFKKVCGYVEHDFPDTIFMVYETLYNQDYCDVDETIMHELLHLIDFHHETEATRDVFYDVMDACL